MADNVSDSNTVSDVLDWVGFSPFEIDWRIKLWQKMQSIINIYHRINGRFLILYTGSRTEGVGMDVLGSDVDYMLCNQKDNVIFNFGDWHLSDGNILMVDTIDVHPGYCRLKPMNRHEPTFPISDQHISNPYLLTYNGNFVLRSDKQSFQFTSRQGPAHTRKHINSNIDIVSCFETNWPPGDMEWIDRDRPSNYPSVSFIREAERRGSHVVPTGHKGSEYQNTEWRFSFAITELDLVHMWPNVVLKCYVLLKLLKNVIVKQSPHLSHTLSSYHLKTLLFWLTEETGLDYWKGRSLIECLMFSLKRLLLWVERGYIAHYMIRSNNLFDMEAGTSRQSDLAKTLRAFVSDGPFVLLRCESYRNWCAQKKRIRPTHNQIYLSRERKLLHLRFRWCLIKLFRCLICYLFPADIRQSIVHTLDAMREIAVISTQCDDDVSMGIDYIIGALRSICGTILLSIIQRNLVSNATSYHLFKISENMLRGSIGNGFVQLKLANFYYQTGYYKRATEILQLMSEKNLRHFKWSSDANSVTISDAIMWRTESPFDTLCSNYSFNVVFVLQEIHATAYALKYEMFKPAKPPSNLSQMSISLERQHACLDPDVFIYYLQYMCYRHMGRQRHAEVAFNNLRWIVKESDVLFRETALNILGRCFLERNQLRQATNCFVKSLCLQTKFSVAPIHLAVLIGKAFGHN